MEYVDTNLHPLDEETRSNFLELNSYLSEQDKSGNILFLYRGEEQRNIRKRLINSNSDVGWQEIFKRVFYIGDKARYFAADVFHNERNFLTEINDCSEETLCFIFDRVSNVLSSIKISRQVAENTSDCFRSFFLDQSNRAVFVGRINESCADENKLRVRDYYLYFLHVAGSLGIRHETMLVSSSANRKIATGFTRGGTRDLSRVVFHYFIPQPFHVHAIAPWVADYHQRLVHSVGLPTYKPAGLFPRQQEISVKGALFPHFMLGVELVNEKKFIVNPNACRLNESEFANVAKHGFFIDQADFQNKIQDTGYTRWVQTDQVGNFESHEV